MNHRTTAHNGDEHTLNRRTPNESTTMSIRNLRRSRRLRWAGCVSMLFGAVCAMPLAASAEGSVFDSAELAALPDGVENSTPSSVYESVSCVSPSGICVAVGSFKNAAGAKEAFSRTRGEDGEWPRGRPASFASGVQNITPDTSLESVSCVSTPGFCVAVGFFKNAAGDYEAFSQTMTAGVWADPVPANFAAGVQSTSPSAELRSVSCRSAGNCTAVGEFTNAAGDLEAFWWQMTAGVWADPVPAPFEAGVQSTSPSASFYEVSCVSAGGCVAVGYFTNSAGDVEAFSQITDGAAYSSAEPARFASGVQNSSPDAEFNSVSCTSGGCTAVGRFKNAAGDYEAFSQTMTAGVWADPVPANFAAGVQSTSPSASFSEVTCVSAGNCVAVGYFRNAAGRSEAFSQTMTSGVWADAVPASFASGVQSTSPSASFNSVSCVSAGNCAAVGYFTNAAGDEEAFSQTMTSGVWAEAVPARFDSGVQSTSPSATFNSVSCAPAEYCVAVGRVKISDGARKAFSQVSTPVAPPSPTTTTVAPATTVSSGSSGSGKLPGTGASVPVWLIVMLLSGGVLMVVASRRLRVDEHLS